MKKLYEAAALFYFLIATVTLLASAFLLVGYAVWEVANAFLAAESAGIDRVRQTLDGVGGLIIIGFAVVEAGTFIAEEELFRKRELRSTRESRRSSSSSPLVWRRR